MVPEALSEFLDNGSKTALGQSCLHPWINRLSQCFISRWGSLESFSGKPGSKPMRVQLNCGLDRIETLRGLTVLYLELMQKLGGSLICFLPNNIIQVKKNIQRS